MDDTHLFNIPIEMPPTFSQIPKYFSEKSCATTINHWYILRKHWDTSENDIITERTLNIFTVLKEKR